MKFKCTLVFCNFLSIIKELERRIWMDINFGAQCFTRSTINLTNLYLILAFHFFPQVFPQWPQILTENSILINNKPKNSLKQLQRNPFYPWDGQRWNITSAYTKEHKIAQTTQYLSPSPKWNTNKSKQCLTWFSLLRQQFNENELFKENN